MATQTYDAFYILALYMQWELPTRSTEDTGHQEGAEVRLLLRMAYNSVTMIRAHTVMLFFDFRCQYWPRFLEETDASTGHAIADD